MTKISNQEKLNDNISNIDILKESLKNEWYNINHPELTFWTINNSNEEILYTLYRWDSIYYKIENWEAKTMIVTKWFLEWGTAEEFLSYTNNQFIWNELYNRNDIVNWKVKDWAKVIKKDTYEFYKTLIDALFYKSANYRSEYIKRAETWNWREFTNEDIDRFINWRWFKIKEFLYLKQEWLVNDELYNKYLPQVIDNLLEQCADTRYDAFKWEKKMYSVDVQWDKLVAVENAAQDVNEEEIKYYFNKWLISAEVAKKALEIISTRNKRDEEKELIEKNIKDNIGKVKNSI